MDNAMTPEQAHEEIEAVVDRACDRYVDKLIDADQTIPIHHILDQSLPDMISRVLRSVESNLWRRELKRRTTDSRFAYEDPSIEKATAIWNSALRSMLLVTRSELRELIRRALKVQMEAILTPIECMETNFFSRETSTTARNAIIVAMNLGIEERYVRALTLLAGDDVDRSISSKEFRAVARDVDAKEHKGSVDLTALNSLSYAALVLGLRTEDEFGEVPSPLARAFMVLRGTPEGIQKVYDSTEEDARVDIMELEELFATREEILEDTGEETHEEVGRFLTDLGVDDDDMAIAGDSDGSSGGVQFILTEDEKKAYITRAVGRNTHLVEPILARVEGVLTWEEVDRMIDEMLPDDDRDEDLSASRFRSRIR
jgi:hypothetical protein